MIKRARPVEGAVIEKGPTRHPSLLESLPTNNDEKLSPEEILQRNTSKILLESEKSVLEDEIATRVRLFDDAVYKAHCERLQLDADIITAELRQISLYEELFLCKSLKKRTPRCKKARNGPSSEGRYTERDSSVQ